MRVTCPNCCETYPLEAGFSDDDGKRLAALFADMEPVLGRAVLGYLRLFRPTRSSLRTVRAIKIVEELLALIRTGTVCRDERGGMRRPATSAAWAAGIEQLLAAPGKLSLPLSNHHYLRAVVYGLADQADAVAERQREAAVRSRPRQEGQRNAAPIETRLQTHLNWLRRQLELGAITAEDYKGQAASARISLGGES